MGREKISEKKLYWHVGSILGTLGAVEPLMES